MRLRYWIVLGLLLIICFLFLKYFDLKTNVKSIDQSTDQKRNISENVNKTRKIKYVINTPIIGIAPVQGEDSMVGVRINNSDFKFCSEETVAACLCVKPKTKSKYTIERQCPEEGCDAKIQGNCLQFLGFEPLQKIEKIKINNIINVSSNEFKKNDYKLKIVFFEQNQIEFLDIINYKLVDPVDSAPDIPFLHVN